MKLRLTAVLRVVPAVVLAAPKTCMTEQELLAEVAMGFLFAQEITARVCDPLLAPPPGRRGGPTVRLQRKIEAKFPTEFVHHSRVRTKFFERAYQENWKEEMGRVNREYASVFLSNPRLGKSECERLRTALEIRLDSPWAYIQAKLDYSAKHRRDRVNICK